MVQIHHYKEVISIVHKETEHPHFGEVVYDKQGNPVCHICGKGFKKLLTHVWQKHELSGNEYKETFGLEKKKGITSEETRELLRQRVKEHYDLVVIQNLIKGGVRSRFKYGDEGRTKDKVSEQTRRQLVTRLLGKGKGR